MEVEIAAGQELKTFFYLKVSRWRRCRELFLKMTKNESSRPLELGLRGMFKLMIFCNPIASIVFTVRWCSTHHFHEFDASLLTKPLQSIIPPHPKKILCMRLLLVYRYPTLLSQQFWYHCMRLLANSKRCDPEEDEKLPCLF